VELLYDIPVIGLIVQLFAYLIDVLPGLAPNTLKLAAPIALGAMCGVMCERSGVVNIGIEGIMLIGAFVGFTTGVLAASLIPSEPTALFGITLPLIIGVGASIVAGMLISTVHAWLTISVRADQIVAGVIINIAAVGFTGYFNHFIEAGTRGAGIFRTFAPPSELVNLPFVGWLFQMFLRQGPIAMSVILIVIALQVLLFRSRWGLRTRAVGEHPKAADTVGINVIALRYRNVIIGGAFAGLAGGYLTLELTSSFQDGMTTGRGFIALAAVIFGRWTPVGALLGALLFAGSEALGIAVSIRPPPGALGELLVDVPNNVYRALPYVLTIIILAGVVGRSIPPAAVGRPYEKESTA
jgi:general nucleoside transport system permease protein